MECLVGLSLILVFYLVMFCIARWQMSRMTPEERAEREAANHINTPEEDRAELLARMRKPVGRFFEENPRYIPVLHQIAKRSLYRDEFGDTENREWHKALRKLAIERMGCRIWFSQKGLLGASNASDFLQVLDEYLSDAWIQ